jgi:hypothetical protein
MRFVQISYDVYDGVDGCHLSKQCSKNNLCSLIESLLSKLKVRFF